MKPKQTQIRVFGQRSITSSFLSRSSIPKEEAVKEISAKKVSCVSLSEFLDQKVNKPSVQPRTVQDKLNPFCTSVLSGGSSSVEKTEIKRKGDEKRHNVLDKGVFEQFKQTNTGKRDASDLLESHGADSFEESRKRQHLNSSSDDKHPSQKPFLILGDSKSKQKGNRKSLISKTKPRPHYNHYANGKGWWDCGMEGIDEEAVGYGEVWEGVGSTTFRGIEWH